MRPSGRSRDTARARTTAAESGLNSVTRLGGHEAAPWEKLMASSTRPQESIGVEQITLAHTR